MPANHLGTGLTRRDILATGLGTVGAISTGATVLARGVAFGAREGDYGPFKMGLQSYSLRGYTTDGKPAVGKALVGSEWQPFVKTIIRVTRQTWLRSAATGMWQPRGEVSYYISSQQGLPAKTWAAIIRGHWGIENRNHYVRDVSCDEDRSRIRDNPGIMARARSFALNILRHNGTENVAQALWNGALSLDLILAYKAL